MMRRLLLVCLTVTLYADASHYEESTSSELLFAGGLAALAAGITRSQFEGVQEGALVTALTAFGTIQLSKDIADRFSGNESVAQYAVLAGGTVAGVALWQDKVPLWAQAALTTYCLVRAVQTKE